MDGGGAGAQVIDNVAVMGDENKQLDIRIVEDEVRKEIPEMGKSGRWSVGRPRRGAASFSGQRTRRSKERQGWWSVVVDLSRSSGEVSELPHSSQRTA